MINLLIELSSYSSADDNQQQAISSRGSRTLTRPFLSHGNRMRSFSRLAAALVSFVLASTFAVTAAAQTPVIVLAAYSSDGTNSGTARLGHGVQIDASVAGEPNATFTWTLQGAGTLTSSGAYTAPAAMPSNGTVSVTATLTSNTSVSATYRMTLEYVAPTIHWVDPSTLVSGETNSVNIGGLDFTPDTSILVGGTVVSSVFQAPDAVIAQIPVAAGSVASLSIVARNPTPGGGSSAPVSATITPITIQLSSYSGTTQSPTTDPLGQAVQFVAAVQGGNPALNWAVSWSVTGGGTVSSGGLYEPPAVMPASPAVKVIATLTTNTSVHATAQFSLVDPVPIVNQSLPVRATAGVTGAITFYGQGFEPGASIQVNGSAVTTTYVSSTQLSASIAVSKGATGSLSITAVNPAPGGGKSVPFSLLIANPMYAEATVGTTAGLSIPGNFLGLSHEWGEAQGYIGSTQTGVNNIYRQLVKNLSNPGSDFFLRIGGGSTDETGEPTSTTVSAFADLANVMPVHFSLGVNLGADNIHLTEDQVTAYVAQMPSGSIAAIELGNEPDNYPEAGFRPSSYGLTGYLSDFATWQAGLSPLLPANVKFIAPSLATIWHMQQYLPSLEQQEAANISIASAHFVGGYVQNASGTPTVFPSDYLLEPSSSTSKVSALSSLATIAHGYGQLFRVDEMNSIDNGGVVGISNTFSSALWSIDTMFEFANAGVDGVNWHGTSGCTYCAVTFGIQNVAGINTYSLEQVNPLYYGLLFFHEATTNSARLLPVTLSTAANMKVWATIDQSETVHVAILNKDAEFAGTVAVTLPGYGAATMVSLVAPSYQSTTGISFGGQTFDDSVDGTLVGSKMSESLEPSDSIYYVTVQPTSAVLLTLTK